MLDINTPEVKGEVITSPFTFPSTVQVLYWNGLTPIFCDIDPITINNDANKIASLITDNYGKNVGYS